MKKNILACCCILLTHLSVFAGKPNVIVFFLDDSGYGDYAHHGNPTIRTPNITRLAQDGVSFTQFYVPSAACSASRYSLLTGRYPMHSELGAWVIGPASQRHLKTSETTLADGLKSVGYKTAMFGKWHLGTPNSKNGMTANALPLAHGFDEWLGTNVSHDYDDAMLLRSSPEGDTPVKGYEVLARRLPSRPKVCDSLTSQYTRSAVRFIRKNKDEPFFIYLAYNMPHLGLYVSDAFRGKSRRGLLGDVMEEVDASVGAVRAALTKAGLTENTILIFSSDNGPWVKFRNQVNHKKYGRMRTHVGYAYPFRDGKGSNWEGGHRVPGVIAWPGTFKANCSEQAPASTLDIVPTVFRLAGVPVSQLPLDGRDIRPLLMPGMRREVEPFTFLYCGPKNQPLAIRQGPWKLHVGLTSQIRENHGFRPSWAAPVLFQVEEDLGERFDRAPAEPQVVKKIKKGIIQV